MITTTQKFLLQKARSRMIEAADFIGTAAVDPESDDDITDSLKDLQTNIEKIISMARNIEDGLR
jgi:hypothetical protein